jgi:hypothetical protein
MDSHQQPSAETANGSFTPMLPFTRAVFIVGVCLTAGTGIGLFAIPDRTADYWAWTIKAPLTAAFFGAGYIGAAASFALAARTGEWRRTRAVTLAALTLTSLALLATLRNLGTFAHGSGGLQEAVPWIWLVVYIALPPLLVSAFVLQDARAPLESTAIACPRSRQHGSLLGARVRLLACSAWGYLRSGAG